MTKSALDICRMLKKLEGFERMTGPHLLEIAQKSFGKRNPEVKEDWRLAPVMVPALSEGEDRD